MADPTDLPAAVRGLVEGLLTPFASGRAPLLAPLTVTARQQVEARIFTWHQRRVEAMERELERWRHGQQIEGDYVCLNGLGWGIAEAQCDHLRADLDAARGELVKEREARNTIARELANRHDDSISLKEEAEKQRSLADHHLAESAMWEVKYDEAIETARRLRAALEKLAEDGFPFDWPDSLLPMWDACAWVQRKAREALTDPTPSMGRS